MTEIQKLENLKEKINTHHQACEQAVGAALGHAMDAGDLLSEVKASLSHGEFGPWLEKNFAGSDRTARAYMRVARHRKEIEAKMAGSAILSIDGALKEIAAPKAKDNGHLGHEWEKAHRGWREALRTPEEGNRLAALQELDRRVRPADLPPGRLHGTFAEELTGEEMNRTFDELIRTGAIANWETTKEDHLYRMQVIRSVLEEMPEGEHRTKLIHDVITAGTVRPHLVDALLARIENEESEFLGD
jgi:hypothetical protein